MIDNSLSIIILAAGKGTRMKSTLPKVLHKVAGREMINLVIDSAKQLKPKNITIVVSEDVLEFKDRIINEHPSIKINFIVQQEKLGTGHAVKIALEKIKKDIAQKCLILYGDTPLLSSKNIQNIADKLSDSQLCIAAFNCFENNMYGRLVVDKQQNLLKIVEFKDANFQEKQITLCNSGILGVAGTNIFDLVSQIKNNNNSKEYYLTDIVGIAKSQNLKIGYNIIDEQEVLGVNSKFELSKVEAIKQKQLRQKMMDSGVTIIDPNSVFFSFDTKIGQDCIIYPQVFFGNGVEIGNNVEIKSFCHLENTKIGHNSAIGPYARIRPQVDIGNNCKIGNFVEIKKSQIADNVKINHLSYVGDCEIGENSNIGAGTITCNYDGVNKYKTKIGKNSFIGSNCALIAPVTIADNCLIGAGSTINKNVEDGDLAIARSKQVNIKNGTKKLAKVK